MTYLNYWLQNNAGQKYVESIFVSSNYQKMVTNWWPVKKRHKKNTSQKLLRCWFYWLRR